MHREIFDRNWGRDWFRWKFERNPYVDHVPIVVAARNGRIVGCRAFFALEMRLRDATRIALQPCDTMVHPDHRRRGLFSRMNELALEYYADRRPAFFFNFPNERSAPGNRKHGWREVGTVPMYYRLQDPTRFLETRIEGDGWRTAPGLRAALETAGSALERVPSSPADIPGVRALESDPDDVSIERPETPPHALL